MKNLQHPHNNNNFNHFVVNALMFFISVLAIGSLLKNAKNEGVLNSKLLEKENLYKVLIGQHKTTNDSIAILRSKNDSLVHLKPKIEIKYEQIKEKISNAPDSVQLYYLESLLTAVEQHSSKKN